MRARPIIWANVMGSLADAAGANTPVRSEIARTATSVVPARRAVVGVIAEPFAGAVQSPPWFSALGRPRLSGGQRVSVRIEPLRGVDRLLPARPRRRPTFTPSVVGLLLRHPVPALPVAHPG